LDQHRIAQVIDRANKSDAADHGRLRSQVDGVAADVDVAVVQGLQELGQREPVGDELVEIDLQLESLRLAAPSDHVDDARYRSEPALEHPVLQCLEIEHAETRRTGELVAVDFADRTHRVDLGLYSIRQSGELRKAIEHLLQRFVVGVIVSELQLYVGQAVKRDGSHDPKVRNTRNLRLDRDGDVTLDLLRGEPRTLRDHEQHQHQHTMLQGEGEDRVHWSASRNA